MADSLFKILLADDEPEIRQVACRRLRSEGYVVVEASDGVEAEKLLVKERPDLLILDVTMPRKSGFDVLVSLRTHPIDRVWRPVIIVSALSEVAHYKEGFALEADHYLTKPCRMEDILSSVRLMASLIPLRSGN